MIFENCFKMIRKVGVRCRWKTPIVPWLVWPSGLSASLQTERSLVRFPVKAWAWVAGQVPSWGHARGNRSMYLSHIDVTFPLSPTRPFSLKINLKILKKKKKEKLWSWLVITEGGTEMWQNHQNIYEHFLNTKVLNILQKQMWPSHNSKEVWITHPVDPNY